MKTILTITFCLLFASSVQADSARVFDMYGDLPFSDEKARLDNFGIQLKNEQSDMVGWYLIFAGSQSCPGEAQRRGIRVRDYIVQKHGIPADRIIWSDEGYREELTVELWIWPRRLGKRDPINMPTVSRSDVQKDANCRAKPPKRQRRIKPQGAPNNSFNRTRNQLAS